MACPFVNFSDPFKPHALAPISEKPSEPIVRPDIEWMPAYKTYKDRVKRLAELHPDRPTTVPEGYPLKVDAERCWVGSDLTEDDYVVHFTPEDIVEIEAALAHFKANHPDLNPDNVDKTTFPLPNLAPRLHEVAETIHHGRGFVVLRGLQPAKYSNQDNILLYLGVTSYIAETRGMQDFDGRMILHIQATHPEVLPDGTMPNSPYVARAQPFHTDLCDILTLYALSTSASGGQSYLASSAAVYNTLAASRPDLLHVLASPTWTYDEFFENQYHLRPLLHLFPPSHPTDPSGKPVFQFSRRPLTGSVFSPHHPLVPAMTESQAEALDAVHFAAESLAVRVDLRPGDMEVVNNFAMLHARSAFADAGDQRRHMLRLWLRNEEMRWTLPDEGATPGGAVLHRLSWECYGEHEWRRGRVWDVEGSPAELRVKHRRASCA
ncbi:hypothetical protein QBC39DRAFT_272118 [Podospora conica]|nr:hypothetical protein QBC39DRAFT_272118 [Schizothecium conicum]